MGFEVRTERVRIPFPPPALASVAIVLSAWILACNDPDGLIATQEVDVTVEGPRPDVTVPDASPESQTVAHGGTVRFQFGVQNEGDADAGPTWFEVRVSRDPVITLRDVLFFTPGFETDDFPPNTGTTIALHFGTWREPLGVFYFGLCAHPTLPESNADNNCSEGLRVTTEAATAPGSNEQLGTR